MNNGLKVLAIALVGTVTSALVACGSEATDEQEQTAAEAVSVSPKTTKDGPSSSTGAGSNGSSIWAGWCRGADACQPGQCCKGDQAHHSCEDSCNN